jgi:tetratricopeptide (TPR) repeat protein
MLGCRLAQDNCRSWHRLISSRASYLLAVTIGCSSICLFSQASFGLSAAEVAKIAKSSAVTISSDSSHGSGIIIQQQGDRYLVLTAAHVVRNNRQKYQITTADDRSYQLQPTAIQPLAGVDLAVVRFTSTKRYQVPKLGNVNESTEGTTIYVSGFPVGTEAIDRSLFNFTDGKVTANSSRPLRDGYSLIYSNNTLPGMSGGGVFNEKGELVAIHGRGDIDTKVTASDLNPDVRVKTGFNLGISINTFQQLASKIGLDSIGPNRSAESTVASNAQPKADDFVLAGFERVDKKDFAGSVTEFTKALELNPKLFSARFWRGTCNLLIGDAKAAIADLTAALELNPRKFESYMYRGAAYAKLGNRQLALADFDRAIALQPQSDIVYGNRCNVKFQLRDFTGAIDDCTRAIKLNPADRYHYSSRGSAYYQLNRYKEAIADHNISIKLDSQNPLNYLNRGLARDGAGDLNGAIADQSMAIDLETKPQLLGTMYSSRAQSYVRAKNRTAAISDFTTSLKFSPTNAETYFFRGNAYYESGNRSAAIADLSRSIQLDRQAASTYLLRGVARTENNEVKQAIADFDTALKLDPRLAATVLANRGVAKFKLADRRGAIADFDRAISLDKEIPKAYYHRGLLKAQSGNNSGAIADLQAAAALYLKFDNQEKYRLAIAKIAELKRNKSN